MDKNKYGDGWENDKLERKYESDYLTEYLVEKFNQGINSINCGSFVLNINAEWGFGKTYFLQNWADDLAKKGHPIVYFDAWQNDFSKEPLIAFIATINDQLKPYFSNKIGEKRASRVNELLSNWFETGKKLLKPSVPILLGILAKRVAGYSLDELSELLGLEDDDVASDDKNGEEGEKELKEAVSTVVSKAASSLLASHNSTKKTIAEFKNNLEKLNSHLASLKTINLPMFIFVDELDRCRPNYAIELLENIKHLFGVYGVFFVVSTASEQLCHSIKAVYGQEFDSPNYLKRFFDQTYILQQPDRHSYAKFIFDLYGLSTRENLFVPLDDCLYDGTNTRVESFSLLCDLFDSSLRDMIQYCIIIDSVSLTFKNTYLHLVYIIILIILRDKSKDLYEKYVYKNIGISKDISLLYKLNNKIKIFSYDDHGRKTKKEAVVSDLVNLYLTISKQDIDSITNDEHLTNSCLENIKIKLAADMQPPHRRGTKPSHSLISYPKLIEQAGRFT